MAENNSSQESLPLSQETFNSLMNMMDWTGKEELLKCISGDNSDLSELSTVPTVAVEPVQPMHGAYIPYSSSSLPAISNWPGDFNFKLLFGHEEKINKHTKWTYSQIEHKLFVQKDAVCPFSFQTDVMMPNDVFLRAMAVYSAAEHASSVVSRCVNHSQQELLQKIFEAQHLIRSDSQLAKYEINPENKRHSVTVPYENPPVGQSYSTYTFRFVCFGSCAGGPNRRPMTLVFTLEQGANVLGRIAVDLKICSCPARDRINAEKNSSKCLNPEPAENKRKLEPSNNSTQQNFFQKCPKKKSGAKKEFLIKVKDEDCYTFLLKMKKLYQANKELDRLSPEYKAMLHILRSSSSEEDEKI